MPKVCGDNHLKLKQSGLFCKSVICFLVLLAAAGAQEANVLRSILPIKSPIVYENRMIYTFNFLFKECPADNWWYYDSLNRQMIIEFYDVYVNVAENISIKGQMPVKEIEVKNVATSIVPSGKKSQIVLHIKKQMHAEVNCLGDTMRVILWKEMRSKETVQQGKRISSLYIIPVLIVLVSGLLGVSFILIPGARS
jgi:hypothetical protein